MQPLTGNIRHEHWPTAHAWVCLSHLCALCYMYLWAVSHCKCANYPLSYVQMYGFCGVILTNGGTESHRSMPRIVLACVQIWGAKGLFVWLIIINILTIYT